MANEVLNHKEYDTVAGIMAYEDGKMDEGETVELFQHLIDNGMAWKLRGHYARMASALIDSGLCAPRAN